MESGGASRALWFFCLFPIVSIADVFIFLYRWGGFGRSGRGMDDVQLLVGCKLGRRSIRGITACCMSSRHGAGGRWRPTLNVMFFSCVGM